MLFRKPLVLPGLLFLLPVLVWAQSDSIVPPVNYQEFRLSNGLRVILHVDKSTPVVAVNVWYHVGSKDESPGKTGFAHLFEHLMFQGSKNYNADFHKPLQEAGVSTMNGITTNDTTNYFEVLPANYLELALFLEADRMGNLLEVLTQERLDVQRDVVRNERRQNYDNQPYGTWREKVSHALYPANHPYHWHPIGSMEDLSSATLEDARAFFRRYYVPNNAILSIAGDLDIKQTKLWVQKYFGPIRKGRNIVRPNPPEPEFDGEKRTTVEDSITQPRLYLAWHGVRKYAPDEAALTILSLILSRGRTSRFVSSLVLEKRMAQSVSAFQENKELAGLFLIQATPASDKSLDEIEKQIDFEIERIKKQLPTTDEISRALNQIESEKFFELQTPLIKGDLLGEFALYLDQPDSFRAQFERYRQVTAADVQRVARNYLGANRLVLTYVPRKTAAAAEKQTSASNQTAQKENQKDLSDRYAANLPKPGPDPRLSLPPVEKIKLSNGLEVWLVQYGQLPIVAFSMAVSPGVFSEPEGKFGIQSMTAGLLRSGTRTRSAVDVSNQLRALGTNLNAYLDRDYTLVTLETLSKNLERSLEIYSDVIVNPDFPQSDVEATSRNILNALTQQAANARMLANSSFRKILYGEHPYGRSPWGDAETVKSISRDDVVNYHRSTFLPNNSVLIIAGKFDRKTLVPMLEKSFAGWKSVATSTAKPQVIEPPRETTVFMIDKPGLTQSTIRIGKLAAARNNSDYASMEVMNSILGFGITSRLSMNLRQSRGYAYESGSDFIYYRTAGHFECWANVQIARTRESVLEILKELNGIRGENPVSEQELKSTRQGIIRRFPGTFGEVAGMADRLTRLAVYGLPPSHFPDYIENIKAVTRSDVNRVADKFLKPDRLSIVIVGDRKVIEPQLRELGYPVVHLDTNGNALP
jgi:zinc protease